MRMTNAKTLFFIAGTTPTAAEQAFIDQIEGNVGVRSAKESALYGATTESADFVGGAVPSAYVNFPRYRSLTPADNQFCAAGDSRVQGSTTTTSSSYFIENSAPIGWALAYIQGRCLMEVSANYGVGGDTTTMLLARWSSVLADSANNIYLMIGANDRGAAAMTLAASIANVEAMLDQAGGAGKRVFLANEMPYESLTGTQLANHLAFRNWLSSPTGALANRPWVIPVDTWGAVADDNSENAFRTGDDLDGLHLAPTGAQRIGQGPLAAAIRAHVPYVDYARLAVDAGDLYHATTNPTGVLIANALMTGTGGANSTGSTGTWADGISSARSAAAANATFAGSKVTGADGTAWQVITVGGTPDGADGRFDVRQEISLSNVTAGDKIRTAGLVHYSGVSNIASITLCVEATVDGVTHRSRSLDAFNSTRLLTTGSRGVQRQVTPALTIPSGTLTSLRSVLVIQTGVAATAATGVVSVARLTPRKVI